MPTPTDPKDLDLIARMSADYDLREMGHELVSRAASYRYSYNFSWLGVPIIQYPEDVMAMQEIIWRVRPDCIVETGVAHGGSLVFYASMLELIGGDSFVVGIDIDIRAHNRAVIERHPMAARIRLVEGSSIDRGTLARVQELVLDRRRVLLALDSNHTHDHVLEELRLYSPLVRAGSYVVVFDTVIEYMPEDAFPNRPWGRGNNPLTAVRQFVAENRRFELDPEYDGKLLFGVAPGGFLRCVEDPQ